MTFIPDIPVYYEELTVWEHLQFIKALYPENSVTVDSLIREFNLNQHLNQNSISAFKRNVAETYDCTCIVAAIRCAAGR